MKNKLLLIFIVGLVCGPVLLPLQVKATDLTNSTAFRTSSLEERSQQIIRGAVRGADGPLQGATVTLVGTNISTVTDANGRFEISGEVGSTLRFTNVGYNAQEIRVTSSLLDIVLVPSQSTIEEVSVSVGYGTQRKSHLTGAISSVNAEEVLGSRPIPDFARGLQGTMPGLSIQVPAGGELGSNPVIRIRGHVGSVSGGSSPLILVDNVEIPNIQFLNPNDIETVTVLKDAASASIYGSKAAFGVILITTKTGAGSERTNVSYSNNFVFQTPFKPIDIAGIDGLQYTLDAHENMNAPDAAGGFWRVNRESIELMKEWQEKYGGIIGNDDPVVYGRDWYWDGVQKFGVRIYDPVAVMVNDFGFSQIHNLALTGRSGNTNYNLSVGYLGQEGMMKPANHDDFRRLTPTLSLSTKVNDKLTIRGGARYAESTKRNPQSLYMDGYAADPWLYLYRWSRLFPIGVQELGQDIIDPAFSAKMSNDEINNQRYANLNLGTTFNFTENWNLNADYAYSMQNNLNTSSVPYVQGRTHWYGVEAWRDENGQQVYVDADGNPVYDEFGFPDMVSGTPGWRFPLTDHTTKDQSFYYQNTLKSARHTFNAFSTYDLYVNGGHDFKFMAGTNIVAYEFENHWSRRTNLINADNPQFNFAIGTETAGGGTNWDSQVGAFGRFNYAFQNKYLFEANLRYDGTSKFPSHLQWRWYPSVSGGWVLTNENFMETLQPVLNFAKLRASWGSIGDQSVSNSLYLANMNIAKNNWLSGSGEQFIQIGTPGAISSAITWQDIEHLNLGADLRLFNNRLGVVGEWYQRYTKNMIIAGDALPATYGTSAPQGNFGHLRTRGWELNLDYTHRFANGLNLRVDGNISDAVTYTTKGADWNIPWENRSLGTTFSTGRRYGDVYGYVTDRLFQKDDFVYDANGNFVQTVIVYEGTGKLTNVQAGPNPVYQTYFEDGNQTLLIKPGDVKFVDVNGDGYITPGKSTNGDPGDRVVIGNVTPRYQYGLRLAGDYKGFDLAVFLQGVGKRSMWGNGQLAVPGYFSKEGAMPQAIAGDYWREDRTDAFYPRAWNMNGANEGFVMRAQSRYMLDMSYLKIKNITFGYSLPGVWTNRAKLTNVRLYVSLENYFTFDNLRGLPIDPEAISGHSMLLTNGNYNLGRTGTSNPSFKSASFGIQIGL